MREEFKRLGGFGGVSNPTKDVNNILSDGPHYLHLPVPDPLGFFHPISCFSFLYAQDGVGIIGGVVGFSGMCILQG